jgi:hypothetical protein
VGYAAAMETMKKFPLISVSGNPDLYPISFQRRVIKIKRCTTTPPNKLAAFSALHRRWETSSS